MKKRFKYYRLNYQITAPTLRLLDEKGAQIGLLNRQEALRLAQERDADLIVVAETANPPVAKIINFEKFKYLESKKERESKKKVKNVTIKEVRFTPFMGEHDFTTRINQAVEFLKQGNQLKLTVPFKGREITKKEFGMNIINKAIISLNESARVIKPPHFEGRVLVSVLAVQKNS